MNERDETVVIDMYSERLLKLYSDLTARMQELGMNSADWRELKLPFELPAGWPVDKEARPTLAQLTVVAARLGMRITIRDLAMSPMAHCEPVPPAMEEYNEAAVGPEAEYVCETNPQSKTRTVKEAKDGADAGISG